VKGSTFFGVIVLLLLLKMINFISGTVFGIIVATIGFGSVAKTLDGVMFNLQKTTVELNRPQLPPPAK
jgi:hypothetical protein